MKRTSHSSGRLARFDREEPRSRERVQYFLRREERVGSTRALVGSICVDGGRAATQRICVQKLPEDTRVLAGSGSKLVISSIHDRMSDGCLGGIARRRSLTPQLARQGNRRLRRLAQDARALTGESA
jgi:hypothetical protein